MQNQEVCGDVNFLLRSHVQNEYQEKETRTNDNNEHVGAQCCQPRSSRLGARYTAPPNTADTMNLAGFLT